MIRAVVEFLKDWWGPLFMLSSPLIAWASVRLTEWRRPDLFTQEVRPGVQYDWDGLPFGGEIR